MTQEAEIPPRKETAFNVSVKHAGNNRYPTPSLSKTNCGGVSILYCIVLIF